MEKIIKISFFRQRCLKRQCPQLNHRLRRLDHPELFNIHNEQLYEASPPAALNMSMVLLSGKVAEDEPVDAMKLVKEVVEGVMSSAWKKLKKTIPQSEENQGVKRAKIYSCENCGQLFAQYLSAVKHCTQSKQGDEGTTCPHCYKKLKLRKS